MPQRIYIYIQDNNQNITYTKFRISFKQIKISKLQFIIKNHILNQMIKHRNEQQSQETKNAKKLYIDKYYPIKANFSYTKLYNYQIIKQIGRGSYGTVYQANKLNSKNSESKVAIKINFNTVSREIIYTEIAFLKLVSNKANLPKLENLFIHDDKVHIVLKYYKSRPFISFFSRMKMDEVRYYLYELLRGLKSLKKLGIYHRDIKPNNFLYDPETKKGILIDFGLAEIDPKYITTLEKKLTKMKQQHKNTTQIQKKLEIYNQISDCLKIIGGNKVGTQPFMSLESILYHHYQSYSSDIWPVGVIFLQIITKKYNIFNYLRIPQSSELNPKNLKKKFHISFILELANFFGDEVINECKKLGYEVKLPQNLITPVFTWKQIARIDNFDDDAQNLLSCLLQLNAEKRITVQQALNHRFFNKVRQQEQ